MDSFRRNPSKIPSRWGECGRREWEWLLAQRLLLALYLVSASLWCKRPPAESGIQIWLAQGKLYCISSLTIPTSSPQEPEFSYKRTLSLWSGPTELGFLRGQYCGVQDKESHSLLVPGRERRTKGSVYLGVRSDLILYRRTSGARVYGDSLLLLYKVSHCIVGCTTNKPHLQALEALRGQCRLSSGLAGSD